MKRRYHLHIPGLAYFGLTLVVALAAMNSQNNLLFWIFGALCSGIVISGLISGLMMIHIRLKRLDPQFGAVGEPMLIRYALVNRSRFLPAFNIHIEERAVEKGLGWQKLMPPASSWVMHIGPRETVHGEAIFWPMRRGKACFFQTRIWTTFPFGIIKKSVTFSQQQHTLIYPQLHELRPDLLRAVSPPSVMGMRTTERPGSGEEYFGLREHRDNDSIRSISWKRSAQLDQFVCIERSSPSPPKLRIIVNLTVPTDQLKVDPGNGNDELTGRELEERAISLAASVAHSAHHAGYEISMIVAGMDVPVIGMRHSYWHLRKIMAALASIDLDAARDSGQQLPSIDAERAGLVVIHPDRAEPLPETGGRTEAMHITGRQLDSIAIRPMGWDLHVAHRRDAEKGQHPTRQKVVAA